MKVLVTGGGGFLGGEIVRLCLERGDQVRSFSRGDYPALDRSGVEVVQGDLADPESVKSACRGSDIVFHVAAKAGIWGRYQDFYRSNVLGTQNILASCRELGIPRLVYTSSPSVVFNGRDMEGIDESLPYPSRFKADYPKTKAMAERLVLAANSKKLATLALRPHLIWGPGDNHLIPGILKRARAGQLRRVGAGDNRVDFTYVEDAARAHLLASERLLPDSLAAGRAFFITQDQPVKLWDFIDRVLQTAGLSPVAGKISPRIAYGAGALLEFVFRTFRLPGEPRMTRFLAEELSTAHWFDISAAKSTLGYQPQVSVEEGLLRVGEWLKTDEVRSLLLK